MTPSQRSPNHAEFVSLKEYLESRIHAVEKGIDVANHSMQKRLDGMNEFREALKDQSARHITRDEVNIKFAAVEAQLKSLQYFKAALEGKASQAQANIVLGISILGLVVAVISLVTR